MGPTNNCPGATTSWSSEARSGQRFKYLVTEMACSASGGPQRHSGRSMGDSYRHLRITEEEWSTFMEDFQETLDTFQVPEREQEELTAIIESTHEAIVVSPLDQATTSGL